MQGIVGPDLRAELEKSAGSFHDLGLSAQDALELEGVFAGFAKSFGTANEDIAKFAPMVAEAAGALATLGGGDASDFAEAIADAAQLGEDSLAKLGISLTEAEIQQAAMRDTGKENASALTDQELMAAAYKLILDKLAPTVEAVKSRTDDATTSQAELGARWETFLGVLGGALEGPLSDLLEWMTDGIAGLQLMAERWDDFRHSIRLSLGPLGDAIDLLAQFVGLIDDALKGDDALMDAWRNRDALVGNTGQISGAPGGGGSARSVQVNVYGGDPAQVEREVDSALRRTDWRTGVLYPS